MYRWSLCTGGLCAQAVFVHRFHYITISTSVADFVKVSIVNNIHHVSYSTI